jgi:hypothetical protein
LALRIEAQQVEEGRPVFPLAEAKNGNQWQLARMNRNLFSFLFLHIFFCILFISLHLSALSRLSIPTPLRPYASLSCSIVILYERERERKKVDFSLLFGCEVFHNGAATIPSFELTAFFFSSFFNFFCILFFPPLENHLLFKLLTFF